MWKQIERNNNKLINISKDIKKLRVTLEKCQEKKEDHLKFEKKEEPMEIDMSFLDELDFGFQYQFL